jgi:ubiquinol-cytochrome c reductase core subunit 2
LIHFYKRTGKMASRFVKSPVVQTSAKRQYAAQAVAKTEHVIPKPEGLKVSTLKNGVTVASIENHGPVTSLGVVVKAGSRNESYENAGISHMLRVSAGLATKKNTAFGITRNLQQAGTGLVCTQGREHTLYSIQTTRNNTDMAVDYLSDIVSNQAFKPWELGDNMPRLKLELAQVSPSAQALELLHTASFRSGLGNSLFCAEHKVGSHSPAQLQQFVSKHFTTGRTALVGVGVSHAALTKYAELLSLEEGSGPSNLATKFYAGEERMETGGSLAYVALAASVPGATSVKEALACMLLQRILGMGAQVKRGNSQGKLAKAAAAASASNHSVGAIGPMYSDSGLLGALVIAEGGSAGKVVAAVAAALRNASVTEAEVAAAKKNLIADVLSVQGNAVSLIEDIGTQVLLAGDVIQADKIPELVSGVSVADVQAAAKRLAGSKLAMGAVGNLSTTPYVDAL